MKITIIAVGKLSYIYRPLQDDLLKRMKNVEVIEIKESNKIDETKTIIKKLKGKDYYVILCDVSGKEMDSHEFSNFLRDVLPAKDVCFIIGGPDGVEKELIEDKIQLELSLSKMTFNHQLCRIVLLEQIYRAFMIWKKHPYALR